MCRCELRYGVLAAGTMLALFSGAVAKADGAAAPSESAVVAPKPLPAAESYQLRYRFEPKQAVHYKVTQKMSISSQRGRVTQTASSDWTTYKHIRVAAVDDEGNVTLETTIDRILATLQFGDEKPHSYDSESDDNPPAPLQETCRTIGKPLALMKFSPRGTLISTEMLQRGENAGQPAAANEEEDGSNNKSFLIALPEVPVRVGESWRDPLTVNVSVPPKLETPITLGRTYTLKGVADGIATIELVTTVLTPVNNPAIMAQLISLTPAGTIRFDMRKGLIVGKTLRSDETVYEFAGPGSKMRADNAMVETVVDRPRVAARPDAEIGPPAAR